MPSVAAPGTLTELTAFEVADGTWMGNASSFCDGVPGELLSLAGLANLRADPLLRRFQLGLGGRELNFDFAANFRELRFLLRRELLGDSFEWHGLLPIQWNSKAPALRRR